MNIKKVLILLLVLASITACNDDDDDDADPGNLGPGTGGPGVDTDPDPSDNYPSFGIPDQNSMSVSFSTYNPHAWDIDGTEVTVTVRLADQLNNNTVPDGTEVFFATEGGRIGSMCTTVAGTCSVTWESTDPRPAMISPELSPGRARVLVWALGTESFSDNNSNGYFDDGDVIVADMPEAFIDKNEDEVRNVDEEFVNFPIPQLGGSGGSFDAADGLYSGINCSHSALCATSQSLFIFEQSTITMSDDCVIIFNVQDMGTGYQQIAFPDPATLPATFDLILTDCNGNPPIAGTTVAVASDVGILRSDPGYIIPSTSVDMGLGPNFPGGSLRYKIIVDEKPDNTDVEIGAVTLSLSMPNGESSSVFIRLEDPANP
jgi:hypothetical protein